MTTIKNINFGDFEESLPTFFSITVMAFTYRISNGTGAGLIFYPITKLGAAKAKDIHPLLYLLVIVFILKPASLPR